jgi:protein-tyrosine phosphatase
MKRPSFLLGGLGGLLIASAPGANALAQSGRETLAVSGGDHPGVSLGIASVPNLRDLGGYTAKRGSVVAYKLIYRSDQLNPVSSADLNKIAALGLKTDFDLRTKAERDHAPDMIPPGVEYVWLDVLKDAPGAGAAQLGSLLKDPKKADATLGNGKAEALFIQSYRDFVSLPSAKSSYHRLFAALPHPGNGPALFHCTTGKDRTGWAAASLLTLLGVSQAQVYADYLRSNEYILPAYKSVIDAFVAKGGDPQITSAVLGVRKAYLDAAFDEVDRRYGSMESYFEMGLSIDSATQQLLRNRFLVAG